MKHGLWIFMLLLLGCGVQGQLKKTNDNSDKILEETKQTHAAIHLQILSVALQQMQAVVDVDPPFQMFPAAKTFAEEATEYEITATSFVLLQEAAQGGTAPDQVKRRFNSLATMVSISALTPDDKATNILTTQVEGRGRYQATAQAWGAARWAAVRDYLFLPALEEEVVNVDLLRDVAHHYKELQYLASRPYVADMKLTIPSLKVALKINPAALATFAKKAQKRFTDKLSKEDQALDEVQQLMHTFD